MTRDVTERERLAEEATQLRLRQQQEVLAAVVATQETERRRIAEVLHNGLGQLLYATKLSLDGAGGVLPAPRESLRLLEEAIRSTRTISFELTPGILEDFGLRIALETLVKRIAPARLPVHLHLHLSNLDQRLSALVEIGVYRTGQELLNNVMKHAQAIEVEVHVAQETGRLYVSVEDNGCGFEPAALAGIGLAGVRNRVALLGGELAVRSQLGRGTIISFEVEVWAGPGSAYRWGGPPGAGYGGHLPAYLLSMKAVLIRLLLPGLAGLLVLAGCQPGADDVDPGAPVAAPKAYVLEVPAYFPALPAAPADNPLTVEGVALGRRLFYDNALSVDNSISCASCHRQALAFTDGRAHAQGVGGGRTLRSAMPLANLLWEPRLTWDGAATTLENQARTPLENPVEMHQPLPAGVARLQASSTYPALFRQAFGSSTITAANLLKALAQFERTLVSGNSRYDQFRRGNRAALSAYEQQGLLLFNTHPNGTLRGGNCGDCHSGDLQTNHTFSNNGLDAAPADQGLGLQTGLNTDNGKFRVPSLRNIALTAPYMHDGRFATLEAVVSHYNEHVALNSPNIDPLLLNTTNDPAQRSLTLDLTADEKAKIVAFMRTLTDTTFTHDPRFARP